MNVEILRSTSERLNWLLHDIVTENSVGLEFGALDNPTPMPRGWKVEYVDYTTKKGLQAHPHEETVKREEIVYVDHVWSGSGSLARVCQKTDYDFAIASQVIEHVPNVLGWFEGIHEVLRHCGVFNLAIPDRRFTFDIRRKSSSLGEMVEAYLAKADKPSIRQIFDHTFDAAAVLPGEPWVESFDVTSKPRYSGDIALQLAYSQSIQSLDGNNYFDSHCWVFTPMSFLDTIEGATRLGIFNFIISDFSSTKQGSFEFYVSFRKDSELMGEELKNCQLAAIYHVKSRVEAEHRAALLLSEL
jgi:SAM-dependent methyltransferase